MVRLPKVPWFNTGKTIATGACCKLDHFVMVRPKIDRDSFLILLILYNKSLNIQMYFFVQCLMTRMYSFEYLNLDNFQPFKSSTTSMRIASALLLQLALKGDFNQAIAILTFLKRQRVNKKRVR